MRLAVLGILLGLLYTTPAMAATAPEVYIHLVGTDDPNINGTVIVAGKQMTIDICCVQNYEYGLEIAQGTCSAPSTMPGAMIAANREWRFSDGHLRIALHSIFPIRSTARYHLFLNDMVARQQPAPVACSDVPQELI